MAHASPTGRLLHGSRLFTLAKPLPAPHIGARASDTATQPYPTRQAIETPYPSQALGEWGLKRHLPTRTTQRSGTPTVRVLAQDTNDHVTNFASAGDHERTLAKFQELSVPILGRESKSSVFSLTPEARPNVSVYQHDFDSTGTKSTSSWKTSGTWVGGMPEAELLKYLETLKEKRPAWDSFVNAWYSQRKFEKRRDEAQADGRHYGPLEAQSLRYQIAYLERLAKEESAALRTALSGSRELSKVDIEQRCKAVVEEAQRHAQHLHAALKTQQDRESAITTSQQADRVLEDVLRKIEQRYPVESEPSAQSEREQAIARALQEHEEKMSQVLSLLESDFASAVPAERGQEARTRVQEAAVTLNQDETRREALQQAWEVEEKRKFLLTESQLRQLQKGLRDDHLQNASGSELTALLVDFLNLSGVIPPGNEQRSEQRTQSLALRLAQESMTDLTRVKPLTTHPGAGLGYLRTNAYMQNHPVHGPQAHHSPVMSRVLRTRSSVANAQEPQAKLGVAGFVALDSVRTSIHNKFRGTSLDTTDPEDMAIALKPYLEGGNKMWSQPLHAFVTEDGRVNIKTDRVDSETMAVKTGDTASLIARKENGIRGMSAQSAFNEAFRTPAQAQQSRPAATPRRPREHPTNQMLQDFKASIYAKRETQKR